MKKLALTFYFISFAILICLFVSCKQQNNDSSGWESLLDKDLSKWRIYQSYEFQDNFRGEILVDEAGEPIPPIGYDKNVKHVFSVIEENNELLLHISGEVYGCVFTKQDFRNYHLKLKFKWGDRKFVPRLNKAMDSGILYHSQGECGVDYWHTWMVSQEFQVIEGGTTEGSCGDFWPIANSRIDIKAERPEGSRNYFYNPEATVVSFGARGTRGPCMVRENLESPKDEWTTMELICYEGKSAHIVNGHVTMILENSSYWNGTELLPLLEGKIQLQCEAAELYYKDIQIKQLTELPEELNF